MNLDTTRKNERMKRWFTAVLATLVLALILNAAPPKLYLTWIGSNSDPNAEPQYAPGDTFYIRSAPNVTTLKSNWLTVTNITYSTFRDSTNRVPIPDATEQQLFYTVTVSNMFGESVFSSPVSTRVPMAPGGLGIGRY